MQGPSWSAVGGGLQPPGRETGRAGGGGLSEEGGPGEDASVRKRCALSAVGGDPDLAGEGVSTGECLRLTPC